MIALMLAAALAASDGSAAPAATPADAPPPAKVGKTGKSTTPLDPNKVVCRSEELPGSKMTTRTCKTRMAWEAQDEQVRRLFRDAYDSGGRPPPPPGGLVPSQ